MNTFIQIMKINSIVVGAFLLTTMPAFAASVTVSGGGTTQSTTATGNIVLGQLQFTFNDGTKQVVGNSGVVSDSPILNEILTFATNPNCLDITSCPVGSLLEPVAIGGLAGAAPGDALNASAWFAGQNLCLSGSGASCSYGGDPRLTPAENAQTLLEVLEGRLITYGRVDDNSPNPDRRSLFFSSVSSVAPDDAAVTVIGQTKKRSEISSGLNPATVGLSFPSLALLGDAVFLNADYRLVCNTKSCPPLPNAGFTCSPAFDTTGTTSHAVNQTCQFNGQAGMDQFKSQIAAYAAATSIQWLTPDDKRIVATVPNTADNLANPPQASFYSLAGAVRTFSSGNVTVNSK